MSSIHLEMIQASLKTEKLFKEPKACLISQHMDCLDQLLDPLLDQHLDQLQDYLCDEKVEKVIGLLPLQ